MEHIKGATQNLRALKEQVSEPWISVIVRTVQGIFLVAFGIFLVGVFSAPWWMALIFGVWGAHRWKGELVTEFLKTVPKLAAAGIREIIDALRGNQQPKE